MKSNYDQNSEFISKWIEALKSNKYKKIRGALQKEEGFCCLGVAADLIDSTQWRCFDIEDSKHFYWTQQEQINLGFRKISNKLLPFFIMGPILQEELVEANDYTKTWEEKVIPILEKHLAELKNGR